MDFTKTLINSIKIWVNKQISTVEDKISDLEERPSAFIQPEEPNEAPDGTLWIDTDEEDISGVGSNTAEDLIFTGAVEAVYDGTLPVTVNIPEAGTKIYTQNEEPANAPENAIWVDLDAEGISDSNDNNVQPDWNQNDESAADYVKNRTHWVEGSGVTIEWDGNIEGIDSVIGASFYKVSDLTPSYDELVGCIVVMTSIDEGVVDEESIEYGADDINTNEGVLQIGNVYVCNCTEQQREEIGIQSNGIYFYRVGESNYVSKLTYGSITVHQLDEKFIPDTIARVADIPEVPEISYPVSSVNGMTGDVIIEASSGLPEVTIDNNGAFLRVVDGVWAIVNLTDVSVEGA